METAFYITEENLIGSFGNAMLKMKKIKEKKGSVEEIKPFVELIEFINKASDSESYKSLLFDKNFIISEEVLEKIHDELLNKKIIEKINFPNLKQSLVEIIKEPSERNIDLITKDLKGIIEVLMQIRKPRQIYM